jgi:hypothetical protein
MKHPADISGWHGLPLAPCCSVDGGVGLEAALERHTAWLKEQGPLGRGKSFVPVTWNDWDMKASWCMHCKCEGEKGKQREVLDLGQCP